MPEQLVKNNRHNLKPDSLRDLQESLYDWQKYNFGDQDNERVLMGICEEAGELCHAHLKLEQGIRGAAEDLEDEMRDAVGDIMIYTLNFLSGKGIPVPAILARADVEATDNAAMIRKSVLAVFRLVGKIVEDPTMTRIRHMLTALLYLCALKGWNLEDVTRETWSSVAQRDWKKYPETGRPTPAQAAVTQG